MTNGAKRHISLAMGAVLILSAALTSCVSTGSYSGGGASKTLPASRMKSAAVQRRNQTIALEPKGDHYIGRRWYTEGTRYWGYIRKPGQPWESSTLIVMNESSVHQPDRVQEVPTDGTAAHGFDHNYEYKLWGHFLSTKVYDPNSNLELPEFKLSNYKLISRNPGFLFYPNEPYQLRGLPPKHPSTL